MRRTHHILNPGSNPFDSLPRTHVSNSSPGESQYIHGVNGVGLKWGLPIKARTELPSVTERLVIKELDILLHQSSDIQDNPRDPNFDDVTRYRGLCVEWERLDGWPEKGETESPRRVDTSIKGVSTDRSDSSRVKCSVNRFRQYFLVVSQTRPGSASCTSVRRGVSF